MPKNVCLCTENINIIINVLLKQKIGEKRLKGIWKKIYNFEVIINPLIEYSMCNAKDIKFES